MNNQLLLVRQRRAELLAKIAAQREQVARVAVHWQRPLAFADQGLVVARFMRSNPLLLGGLTALLVIRRRGLLGLGMTVWRGWKLYRLAKSFASNSTNHS
jgi:hypothetical protein